MKALFLLAFMMMASSPALSNSWTVTPEESRLGFETTQMGASFEGSFNEFKASITFDPQDLASSVVDIVIPIASVDTQSADRDSNIVKPEWFDAATYPEARFVTKSITAAGEGYKAVADLTMRGVTKTVELPFMVKIDGNQASAQGEVSVIRQDYGIGQGEWVADTVVGSTVRIFFDIKATTP